MSFWGGTDEDGNPDHGTAGGLGFVLLLFSCLLYIMEKCIDRQQSTQPKSYTDSRGRLTLGGGLRYVGERYRNLFRSLTKKLKRAGG